MKLSWGGFAGTRNMRDLSARIEALGFDTVGAVETQHDPFVQSALPIMSMPVTILNFKGQGKTNSPGTETGDPPDTNGAAGPSAYVETVNQAVALYANKNTGAGLVTDSLSHFLFMRYVVIPACPADVVVTPAIEVGVVAPAIRPAVGRLQAVRVRSSYRR